MRGSALRTAMPVFLLGFSGCVWSTAYYEGHMRCPESPPEVAGFESCMMKPEVDAYLRSAREEIFDSWRLPWNVSPDQALTLTFAFERDGSIGCLSLEGDEKGRLRRSVLAAVQRAEPFPPLDGDLECIAGAHLEATFENPSRAPEPDDP